MHMLATLCILSKRSRTAENIFWFQSSAVVVSYCYWVLYTSLTDGMGRWHALMCINSRFQETLWFVVKQAELYIYMLHAQSVIIACMHIK